jgi:hypothetical protein
MCRVLLVVIDHPNHTLDQGDIVTIVDDGGEFGRVNDDPNHPRWTVDFPYPYAIVDLPGLDGDRLRGYLADNEYEWLETEQEYLDRIALIPGFDNGRRRRVKRKRQYYFDLSLLPNNVRNRLERDRYLSFTGDVETELESRVKDKATGNLINRGQVRRLA